MASPVVAGTVALMLQANPNLTPNLVKAILQYTAQVYPGYNALTQGAGFLNTKGAVELARFFKTAQPGNRYLSSRQWSKSVLWGNHRIAKGVIKPNATAWKLGVVWGALQEVQGTNIVWGTYCADECDNVVWGTNDSRRASSGPWRPRATSCGAPSPARPLPWKRTTTSCGARWRTKTTSCGAPTAAGADCADVVWGTRADARGRQHRVGHDGRGRQRRVGHQRRRRQRRMGHVERRRRRHSPGEVRATTRRCSTTRTWSR